MAGAEDIVICIDSSYAMISSKNYQPQLEAIEHYCKAKFDANPENKVALFVMGSMEFRLLLHPCTRDLQKILNSFSRIKYLGPSRLKFSVSTKFALTGFPTSDTKKQKRMLFFAGGPVDLDPIKAVKYGKELKELGIAVDVVNFYVGENLKCKPGPSHNLFLRNLFGKMELDAFFTAANCNDNSHIEHIEDGSTVCQVLSDSMLQKTPWKKIHHNKVTGKNQASASASAYNKPVPILNRFQTLSINM